MKRKIQRIVLVGVFAAILAVLSQLSVPLPGGVPVTLQTFTASLVGYILGWRGGLCTVAVYTAMGAAGLPVFSMFSGGVGVLLGVTGGFLWGFFPLALLCGIGGERKYGAAVFLGLSGLALCHLLGVLQFSAVSGNGLLQAFLTASAPYLIKDVISVAAACSVSRVLKKALRRSGGDLTVF